MARVKADVRDNSRWEVYLRGWEVFNYSTDDLIEEQTSCLEDSSYFKFSMILFHALILSLN